jgi:hypothetical protein
MDRDNIWSCTVCMARYSRGWIGGYAPATMLRPSVARKLRLSQYSGYQRPILREPNPHASRLPKFCSDPFAWSRHSFFSWKATSQCPSEVVLYKSSRCCLNVQVTVIGLAVRRMPALVTELVPLGSFATWQAERAIGATMIAARCAFDSTRKAMRSGLSRG